MGTNSEEEWEQIVRGGGVSWSGEMMMKVCTYSADCCWLFQHHENE